MAWGVEDFGHLAVVGAVGVLTEGGVSVLVFEGLPVRPLLGASFLAVSVSSLRVWRSEGVIVDVPSWRGEVEPGGFGELVRRAGLVLPQSGLKVADRQDRTRFGLDQTAQAVYSPKTENDGPDRGWTEKL